MGAYGLVGKCAPCWYKTLDPPPPQLIVKSLFILWITGPRSSVRPSLTRAWWLSATGYVAVLEPPPGRGDRQWLGSLPRYSAGVGIPHSHCQVTRSTAILAHSIPSPSSHGSAMARTGRKSLIHTQPNPTLIVAVGGGRRSSISHSQPRGGGSRPRTGRGRICEGRFETSQS